MPKNHPSAPGKPPDRAPPVLALSSGPYAGAMPAQGWTHELPLQGVTILAVEDSRFACEALRLMARRAGARLRRAETISAARAHLRVYRPDVVLVDLGLPDGRGEDLIKELAGSPRRPLVIMGTSGNPDGRAIALGAGADGFIDKPLENLAQLCRALRPHLPELDIHPPPIATATLPRPDPLALHDDLAFAARQLQGNPGPEQQRYVSAFVGGVANHAHDAALAAAADQAANTKGDGTGLKKLRRLIAARPSKGNPFNKSG